MRKKPLLYAALAFVSLGVSSCSEPAADSAAVELIADFNLTRKHLIVKNGDMYVWKQAAIYINRDYKYSAQIIPRGSSSIPLTAFVNENGENYAGLGGQVRSITIHVPQAMEGRDGWFRW